MATTPEGKVKKQVKALLAKHGVYYEMPVPTGFGKPGLDFVCCHRGRYFQIETKAPGQLPTARQQLTIKNIHAAEGVAFVIDGTECPGWVSLVAYLEG